LTQQALEGAKSEVRMLAANRQKNKAKLGLNYIREDITQEDNPIRP
jgi:hypothetical protein